MINVNPIGVIHSPFKEKFSIPRQPGLAKLESVVEMHPPYNRDEALYGLEQFSHIWILFFFHDNHDSEALSVRPPRLGGNKKLGVFATRSPNRPNKIGMSLVEVIRICDGRIFINGGDFLDQTPVIDIKPYVKEVECVVHASTGWLENIHDEKLDVEFDCECDEVLKKKIIEVLSLDPRPRFHEDGYKTYGSRLENIDVHWKVENGIVRVVKII